MPIKSYLAHPYPGQKKKLSKALSAIENCEVIVADNEDLLVVVTDTDNAIQEDFIKEQMEALDSLKLLAMVAGFNT